MKAPICNLPWPTLNMAHAHVHFDNVGHAGQLSTKSMQDAKIKKCTVLTTYCNYEKCDVLTYLNKERNCFRDFFIIS